jgi:hypothetical protein
MISIGSLNEKKIKFHSKCKSVGRSKTNIVTTKIWDKKKRLKNSSKRNNVKVHKNK